MGQERVVTFAGRIGARRGRASAELLTVLRLPGRSMRMIDGELAFPDEQPPESWAELRVGTPARDGHDPPRGRTACGW